MATTTIFTTGFEHGVATMSTSGGGLASSVVGYSSRMECQSTVKRTGTYALKVAPSASNDAAWRSPTWTGIGVMRGVLYIRFGTLPTSDVLLFSGYNGSTGPCVVWDNSTTKLAVATANTSTGASISNKAAFGTTISTGTFYRVDFEFTVNSTTWTLKAQLDGANEGTSSPSGMSSTTVTAIQCGSSNASGPAYTAYYDDVLITSTVSYPIGAIEVYLKKPASDGTHQSGTVIQDQNGNVIDGVTYYAWSLMDEVPATSTTDYVKQTEIGGTNYAEIKAETVSGTIQGARAIVGYTSAATQQNNGSTVWHMQSYATTIYGGDMSESTMFYKSGDPNAAGYTLTATEINDSEGRVGYSSDATPDPYWHFFALEIAFGAATPQTITVTTAIDSGEAFGTAKANFTLKPSAFDDGSYFGDPTVTKGPPGTQYINATGQGIAGAEAFGATRMILFVKPSSIDGAEAFGTSKINHVITATGIAGAEAFGTSKLNFILKSVGAIPGSEAFGTASFILEQFIDVGGYSIGSTEAFGTAKVNQNIVTSAIPGAEAFGDGRIIMKIVPSAIGSGETFGATMIVMDQFLNVSGGAIGSGEAFGDHVLSKVTSIWPSSITSEETFGTAKLNLMIAATGIATGEDFGSLRFRVYLVVPAGITSAEELGTPSIVKVIIPSAIGSGEAFGGVAKIDFRIFPSSVASSEAFGAASITTGKTIIASGIGSGEEFGSVVLVIDQTIFPSAIAGEEAFGTARINRNIKATGITSEEAFGAAAILRIYRIVAEAIASGEIIPNPAIIQELMIIPAGIASGEAFGSTAVYFSGIQFIYTTGIVSSESFGTTSILVYYESPALVRVDPKTMAEAVDPRGYTERVDPRESKVQARTRTGAVRVEPRDRTGEA